MIKLHESIYQTFTVDGKDWEVDLDDYIDFSTAIKFYVKHLSIEECKKIITDSGIDLDDADFIDYNDNDWRQLAEDVIHENPDYDYNMRSEIYDYYMSNSHNYDEVEDEVIYRIRDYIAYERDPYSYNGVSRSDFF